MSKALLAELEIALSYSRLRERIGPEEAADFLELLRSTASVFADAEHPDSVSGDPGDDYLVALATASASILVTGDSHLLVLASDLPIQPTRGISRALGRLRSHVQPPRKFERFHFNSEPSSRSTKRRAQFALARNGRRRQNGSSEPSPATRPRRGSKLIADRRRRRRRAGPSRLFGLAIGAVAVIAAAISVQALLNARAGAAETSTSGARPQVAGAGTAGQRVLTVKSPDLPAGLVAGTCVEFDPTGADRHRTIYVDPGHGGPDPGAVGNRVEEKELTLAVALQLKDMLRADGFHVVLSRITDSSVAKLADSQVVNGAITNSGVHIDTIARIACGNTAAADAMVAIHFNAFDDPGASGAETFYDDARDFAAANLRLATLLQTDLQASFRQSGWQVYDRGVLSDADTGHNGLTAAADAYGRLMQLGPAKAGWNDHPSLMPGALVEPFYVTDPVEAQVAGSVAGKKAIAAGLEQGLVAFLAPPTPSPSANPTG